MTYQERLTQAKLKYKGCTPIPAPIPVSEPDNYQILNLKLVQPSRTTYFVPLGCNTGTKITHLIRLSMCGTPMQTIRHRIEFYATPPNAKIVQDTLDTHPLITGYTRPFLFHSTQQAHDEIHHFLNTQI